MGIGTPVTVVNFSTTTGSGTTTTTTTSANIVTGDLVVFGIYNNASGGAADITISSVSDGTNSYVKAVGQIGAVHTDQEIWYVANATAVSSGATVTVTWSAGLPANSPVGIAAVRVTGIISASPLDKTNSNSGSSTTSLSTTTGVLSTGVEIVIGVSWNSLTNGTYNGATGFTNAVKTALAGTNDSALDYDIVSSTSSVTYNSSWGGTGNIMIVAVATFKGISGTPPGNASTSIPWTLTWYQSIEHSNTFYLGKDILPTRVLQTLPPPPVIWYKTWPEEGYVSRELVTLPFNQYDWPLPKVLYWYRSWEVNHTPFLGKDIVPKNQYDWPLPKSWWWDRFEGSNQGLYISASPVPPALVFPFGRRLIPDYTKNAYIPYPIGLRF